ncbi:hypothetical protein [Rhodoferax sp.]|uniref:hypothetical protein n=1 Tax=Rhodoferax sp. TaxID=50421 RepID=UPI003426DC96
MQPKAGQRIVSVTERRTKADFVAFIGEMQTGAYAKARRVHLVLDNLNTHFRIGDVPAEELIGCCCT